MRQGGPSNVAAGMGAPAPGENATNGSQPVSNLAFALTAGLARFGPNSTLILSDVSPAVTYFATVPRYHAGTPPPPNDHTLAQKHTRAYPGAHLSATVWPLPPPFVSCSSSVYHVPLPSCFYSSFLRWKSFTRRPPCFRHTHRVAPFPLNQCTYVVCSCRGAERLARLSFPPSLCAPPQRALRHPPYFC